MSRSMLLRPVVTLALLLGLVTIGGVAPAQAAESAPVTYQDQSYAGLVTSPPTADKPQSKLFFAQGSWWAIMLDADGNFRIHELMPDHTWRIAGNVVDSRVDSTADLLYDGSKLYVASRNPSTPLQVSRMSFQPLTRSWTVDTGFPVTVNAGGSESAAIEKDSTGQLWVTWTKSLKVWVSHTTIDDQTWSTPTQPAVGDTTISADDISGLISFKGKIGIMYSDEGDQKFSFAVHQDTDPDGTWSYESITNGALFADDHINLKNVSDDPAGRVYAVVKTSKNDPVGAPPTDPLIVLLVREADGTWSQHTVATVADEWTRPQVQIDTVNKRVLVFGTAPIKGGTIYEKTAQISDLTFPTGRGTPYVTHAGSYINNASGTKQPLTQQTGVVILASSGAPDYRYFHTEQALTPDGADQPPSPPGQPVANNVSSTKVALSWAASTDDKGVVSYTVMRDGVPVGTSTTTSFTDSTVQPSTTYEYTVTATDTAGQSSPSSVPTTVTTSDPPVPSSVAFVDARSGSTTGTSVAVDTPAAAAGQVTLLGLAARGNPKVTAPAGWTLVRTDDNGTTMRQQVYRRVATAATPAGTSTFTLSSSQSAAWSDAVYAGVSTTTPIGATAASVNAASKSVAIPAVTGTAASTAVSFAGIAAAASVTPPAGWTERGESSTPTATYKVTGDYADTTIPASGSTAATSATATVSGPSIGQTVALNPAASTPPPPTDQPPTAPGQPTASGVTSAKVDLSWAASTDDHGVASYQVLRDGTAVGTSTTTSFTDSTVSPSSTYSYTVKAVDTAGQSSPASPATSVTTPAAPPPPPASSVTFVDARSGSTTGTSVAVDTPAAAAGQVTLLGLAARGNPKITAPAGWTLVRTDDNGTAMRQQVYRRVATAATPAGTSTFALSSSQSVAWTSAVYAGVSTTTPIGATAASANASSKSIAIPAVTGTATGRAFSFAGIASAASITPATGWTERGESSTPTATYKITGESADTGIPASGTVPAAAATSSVSGVSIGSAVALNPAP